MVSENGHIIPIVELTVSWGRGVKISNPQISMQAEKRERKEKEMLLESYVAMDLDPDSGWASSGQGRLPLRMSKEG